MKIGKELSEMTLHELWELFPIFLVVHDDKWEDFYNEIEKSIKDILSGFPVERISHIGSTAIHGIWAKDIVDVMINSVIKKHRGPAPHHGVPNRGVILSFL